MKLYWKTNFTELWIFSFYSSITYKSYIRLKKQTSENCDYFIFILLSYINLIWGAFKRKQEDRTANIIFFTPLSYTNPIWVCTKKQTSHNYEYFIFIPLPLLKLTWDLKLNIIDLRLSYFYSSITNKSHMKLHLKKKTP